MGNRRVIHGIQFCVWVLALGVSPSVRAGGVFGFSDGTRAAQATFSQDGTTLSVTLANPSTFDVLKPSDVLTGVYFGLDNLGGAQLTAARARSGIGGQ